MAVDIYSLTEWQFAIKPETIVGTSNTDTMQLVNVDVPIAINDNPSIASEIRTKDGRTKKSVDHFATKEGQVKSITISGIADKTVLLILAENCFGIAEASNVIDLPYNFTGSAFKYGKTSVTDNLHTLTCALVSVIGSNTRIYPGCIVDELSWVEDVETDGGRRHFTATFLTRSNPSNDQATPSSMSVYPSTYYSIWDYTSKLLGASQTEMITDSDNTDFTDGTINEWIVFNNGGDGTVTYSAGPGSEKTGLITVGGTPGTDTRAHLPTSNLRTLKFGKIYSVKVDVYLPSANNSWSAVKILMHGIDNTDIDVSNFSANLTTEDSWQTLTYVFQVTGVDVTGNVEVYGEGTTTGDLIYYDNINITQVADVIVSKLEISIKSNVKFYGLGTNGVCEVMDRGFPGFDVSAVIGVKYDNITMGESLKYPAGTAINLYFADNAVLSSATFGIQSDYSYLTADLNLGNVDEGAFIDIPLEFKAGTSGSQLQIAL